VHPQRRRWNYFTISRLLIYVKLISGGRTMDEHEKDAAVDDDRIDKVRRRAHAIWLDQGMPHGRDQEHWHEAEREIAAEAAERASPKTVAPTESSAKAAAEKTSESSLPYDGKNFAPR
jgi:hypothetical protein